MVRAERAGQSAATVVFCRAPFSDKSVTGTSAPANSAIF